MRNAVWLMATAATLLVSGVLAAERVAAPRQQKERPAPSSMSGARAEKPLVAVLFASSRPLFLQLRVQVDGQSVKQFRQRFCDQTFRQFDHDKDGFLNKAEFEAAGKQIPSEDEPPRRRGMAKTEAVPKDRKISREEFRNFVNRRLGAPLVVVARNQEGAESDRLFKYLDLNGDGALTADELRQARQTLAHLDADDDETISVAELNADSKLETPRGRKVAAAARLPFAVIGQNATAESAAERLVNEYARAGAASKAASPPRSVEPAALGLSAEVARPFDRDSDGKLSIEELARLIVEMSPQVELRFDLFDQQRGRTAVAAVAADGSPPGAWKQSSGDEATWSANGIEIALAARRTRASTGDMRGFYAVRFHIVDQDKNNYLDKQEFAALGLPNADFKAVDANGDGQIVESELTDYLGGQASTPENQVVIVVSQESKSLFDLLDTRPDRRLSPRELNAAVDRLMPLDANKDGKITPGELRTELSIEVEVKRPAAPRQRRLVVRRRRGEAAPTISRDSGPEWFQRMDRNYDGDVSRREFLGPPETFDRLDTDHDGLLSPEEAEQAR